MGICGFDLGGFDFVGFDIEDLAIGGGINRDSSGTSELVIQKTRTVRVCVPYPHCTGAARTQIVDFMDTNTLRDTQKILKKNFFLNFSENFSLKKQIVENIAFYH